MTERLSDDELNALGKDGNWDTRYGERAIKELRDLRARKDAALSEGINHHDAPEVCMTCMATESEVKALRAENVRLEARLKGYQVATEVLAQQVAETGEKLAAALGGAS